MTVYVLKKKDLIKHIEEIEIFDTKEKAINEMANKVGFQRVVNPELKTVVLELGDCVELCDGKDFTLRYTVRSYEVK